MGPAHSKDEAWINPFNFSHIIIFLTTKVRLRRTSLRGPSGLHEGSQGAINHTVNDSHYIVQSPTSSNLMNRSILLVNHVAG